MKNTLYLASNSTSRRSLLEQANIPCEVIKQEADESLVSRDQPLKDIVCQIAVLKMKHVQLPEPKKDNDICFVLTSDTMGLTQDRAVLGKPDSKDDAIRMLKACREGSITITGYCLRKMQSIKGVWHVTDEIIDYDEAELIFNVPDPLIDYYLDNIPFLEVSGAISIEGFGGQFCQSVKGSYESIIGLPIYKIRENLFDLNFYTFS